MFGRQIYRAEFRPGVVSLILVFSGEDGVVHAYVHFRGRHVEVDQVVLHRPISKREALHGDDVCPFLSGRLRYCVAPDLRDEIPRLERAIRLKGHEGAWELLEGLYVSRLKR